MHEFSFGDDFLLGVASAATQIEGGEGTNSWYDWYEKGHITDSSDPHIANEHYKSSVSKHTASVWIGQKLNLNRAYFLSKR